MSADEPTAHYRFLPWVRNGYRPTAETDRTADSAAVSDVLGTTAVTLVAQAYEDADGRITPTESTPATVDLRLYGPGDVVGIDRKQIVRTEPTERTREFPPNYFPFVEFDRPDLPWLFSPTGPDDGGAVRPWFVLVVVEDREGVDVSMPTDGPLAVLDVDDAATELPDLTDAWAWAHAQVVGDPVDLYDGDWLAAELAADSEITVSRVLTPRRLQPGTAYRACLVPTFEAGRLAGLGADPEGTDTPYAFAWDDDGPVRLPVYYEWAFATGAAGDFESLVRRLDPIRLPESVGGRAIDVSDPGPSSLALDPDAAGSVLELGGALRSAGGEPVDYPVDAAKAVRDLLNAPADTDDGTSDPVVGPPVYGRWHAPAETVGTNGWTGELNLSPPNRVTANYGTSVIQDHQEALMTSAWAQLGDVQRANRLLRGAQLARGVSAGIHADLAAATDASVVGMTGLLHDRLRAPVAEEDTRTVAAAVDASRVPRAAFEPAFRRLVRSAGPLGKRTDDRLDPESLVSKLAAGTIAGAPALDAVGRSPDGMVSLGDAASDLCDAAGRAQSYFRDLADSGEEYTDVLIDAVDARTAELDSQTLGGDTVVTDLGTAITVTESESTEGTGSVYTFDVATGTSPPTGDTTGGADGEPTDEEPADSGHDTEGGESVQERRARLRHERDLLLNELRRVAGGAPGTLADAVAQSACEPAGPVDRTAPPLDLPATADSIRDALDPERTLLRRTAERIGGADGREEAYWERDDPLAPLLAVPEFPQPMYEPLKDLSQEYLLPGADDVPADSLGVLATDPAFVEAYMLGCNHEMAREFRWREYPTVPWGTYFRQFWDVRGHVPQPADENEREALTDIQPIRRWRAGLSLGENAAFWRLLGAAEDGRVSVSHVRERAAAGRVVLLVRGELLRRYPRTTLYAVRARLRRDGNGDVVRDPDTDVPLREPVPDPNLDPESGDIEALYPAFRGRLDPDVTFIGFDLDVAAARGDDLETAESGDDPGWFFVIEEPPTEPRFGLDSDPDATYGTPPTEDWNDLAWGHVLDDPDGYASALDPTEGTARNLQGTRIGSVEWGRNSAHVAYATWQRPVRVAVHAAEMLPASTDGDNE